MSFKWKDYRVDGPERIKVMTLAPKEFIRRFLIHVLPAGLTTEAVTKPRACAR